ARGAATGYSRRSSRRKASDLFCFLVFFGGGIGVNFRLDAGADPFVKPRVELNPDLTWLAPNYPAAAARCAVLSQQQDEAVGKCIWIGEADMRTTIQDIGNHALAALTRFEHDPCIAPKAVPSCLSLVPSHLTSPAPYSTAASRSFSFC